MFQPPDCRQTGNNSIRGHKRVCRYESRKRSQLLYCVSLGENLSDCQGQTSQNKTSGPRRRESVLAHTFRVARDSGIILWTAKMPFQVALLSLGQFMRKRFRAN